MLGLPLFYFFLFFFIFPHPLFFPSSCARAMAARFFLGVVTASSIAAIQYYVSASALFC